MSFFFFYFILSLIETFLHLSLFSVQYHTNVNYFLTVVTSVCCLWLVGWTFLQPSWQTSWAGGGTICPVLLVCGLEVLCGQNNYHWVTFSKPEHLSRFLFCVCRALALQKVLCCASVLIWSVSKAWFHPWRFSGSESFSMDFFLSWLFDLIIRYVLW